MRFNVINFQTAKMYKTWHNFFDMIRIDFLIDENFEPHLSEANMSPAAPPGSSIFEQWNHQTSYEQVIYNTVNLVGGGSFLDLMSM